MCVQSSLTIGPGVGVTPSSPVSPWIYIVSSDRDLLPFKDITLALTRIITHVNNCDVFEDCVQSKRRRELLGSTSLFGKIALYDDDLLGLVSGRKERRMQQVNGYQVFGALQCPSRPPAASAMCQCIQATQNLFSAPC